METPLKIWISPLMQLILRSPPSSLVYMVLSHTDKHQNSFSLDLVHHGAAQACATRKKVGAEPGRDEQLEMGITRFLYSNVSASLSRITAFAATW